MSAGAGRHGQASMPAMMETPHGRWRASAARPTLSGSAAPAPTAADPASSERSGSAREIVVKRRAICQGHVAHHFVRRCSRGSDAVRLWPQLPSYASRASRPSMWGPRLQRGRHQSLDPHYFTCPCTRCVHASRGRHACAARSAPACRCVVAAAACRRAPPRAAARHPAAPWAVARPWPRGGNGATSCPRHPTTAHVSRPRGVRLGTVSNSVPCVPWQPSMISPTPPTHVPALMVNLLYSPPPCKPLTAPEATDAEAGCACRPWRP